MYSIELINYIKAPSGSVYDVLTSETGLASVWTKKLKVKPELGFINEFDFDEGYLTLMKIIELDQAKRISWECISSDPEWVGTIISFELSEQNGITKVVLKQEKWKAMNDFYRWCNYNWSMLLLRLKNHCEQSKTS